MALLERPELQQLLTRLTQGMREYMDAATPKYSSEHIDKCRNILISHAETLEQVKDRAASLELAKSTVIQLNRLNNETQGDLIETDQREQICGFIIKAGAIMRFNSENEDVTEEWREW